MSVVVLLAGLAGGAFAMTSDHACVQMNMDDCPDGHGDGDATIPVCAQSFCGLAYASLPHNPLDFSHTELAVAITLTLRHDADRSGLDGPPDLRPPIV